MQHITKDDTKLLAFECQKFLRYVDAYFTRAINVANVVGKPGRRMLERIGDLADAVIDKDQGNQTQP